MVASLAIYNAAAIVDNTRGFSGDSGKIASKVKAHVSQLSRMRAGNGDPRLSFETQQAVREGALSPTVAKKPIQKQEVETTLDTSDTTKPVDTMPDAPISYATLVSLPHESASPNPYPVSVMPESSGQNLDIVA